MKYLYLIPLLASSILHAQSQSLRKNCDEQYTRDMQTILNQFASLADEATLKNYKAFQIMIKQYEDIGFQIHPFEKSITSDVRAQLRTPMQRYNDCRTAISGELGYTSNTMSAPKALLQPCDSTYASVMQSTINYFAITVSKERLKEFQDFMIMLKYYEDLAFKIRDFERKTPTETISRLRFPMSRYMNCRDAIIRTFGAIPQI